MQNSFPRIGQMCFKVILLICCFHTAVFRINAKENRVTNVDIPNVHKPIRGLRRTRMIVRADTGRILQKDKNVKMKEKKEKNKDNKNDKDNKDNKDKKNAVTTMTPTMMPSNVISMSPSTTTSPSLMLSNIPSTSLEPTLFSISSPSSFPNKFPSVSPSSSPSSSPTSSPTISPTSTPTKSPSILPSSNPTKIPVVTNSPSRFSQRETIDHTVDVISGEVSVPTSSKPFQSISLPIFMMMLSTESPIIDLNKFVEITSMHVTNVFDQTIPESLSFKDAQLQLSPDSTDLNSRRLRERNIFMFEGQASFSPDIEIEANVLKNGIFEAFTGDRLAEYESSLKDANIIVLSTFVQLKEAQSVQSTQEPNEEDGTTLLNDDKSGEVGEAQGVDSASSKNTTFNAMESVYVVWGLAITTVVTFLVLSVAAFQKHRSNNSYTYENFVGEDTLSSQGKMSEVQSVQSEKKFDSPDRHIYGKTSGTSSSMSDKTKYLESSKKVSFSEDEDFTDSSDLYGASFDLPENYNEFRQKLIMGIKPMEQSYIQFQPNQQEHFEFIRDQNDTPETSNPIQTETMRDQIINSDNPSPAQFHPNNQGFTDPYSSDQSTRRIYNETDQNEVESSPVSPIPFDEPKPSKKPLWRSKLKTVRRNDSRDAWLSEMANQDVEKEGAQGTMFM